MPGYYCLADTVYEDCASPCICCSDRSRPAYMCDECVQGCTCPPSKLQDTDGHCVDIDMCPCKDPNTGQYVPAYSTTTIGCSEW